MAVAEPFRTYPCPHCGEILFAGTVQQAVVIWGLALFATPIRYFIEYGVR